MASLFRGLKNLDAFSKTHEDYRIRTASGGWISIVSCVVIVLLLVSELSYYNTVDVENELSVDTSRGDLMQIHIDFIFPKLPCSAISVDVMDISGSTQLDINHNLFKKRLDKDGHPIDTERKKIVEIGKPKESNETQVAACGDCYGAADDNHQCCNTCEDLKARYAARNWNVNAVLDLPQCANEHDEVDEQIGEGCNIYGFLEVNKVAGNFHFAPGRTVQINGLHMHDTRRFDQNGIDLSHTIRHLSFGDHFPGVVYPLNGISKQAPEDSKGQIYKYFVKIVPTIYRPLTGEMIRSNQYSSTEHFSEARLDSDQSVPGVLIHYEASPIMVSFTERQRSFTHFLTSACAIIGGIFTVSSLIDSLIHHTVKPQAPQRKVSNSKAN